MKRKNQTEPQRQVFDYQGVVHRIINRIRQSLELQEILNATVEEVGAFLETDRVKIYCFHSDGSGEVLAESIRGNCLPSLLGLRFPAGDIPPHARELFTKSRLRVIVDVASQQKTLNQLDDLETGEHLDVEQIRYGPVSACHAEYLTTMGVYSSLSVPILHQNKLWGLLISHHAEPHQYCQDELQVVQILVDQLSIAIAQANLLTQARQQVRHEAMINQISRLLHSPRDITQIRQSVLDQTVEAFGGKGGRLYIGNDAIGQPAQLYLYGEQPTLARIEESHSWQQTMGMAADIDLEINAGSSLSDCEMKSPATADSNLFDNPNIAPHIHSINDLYQDPQLQFLAPAFEKTAIRSILIVPLQYRHQCIGYLSIFRAEIDTETLWAGRQNQDDRNTRPRQSFEAWQEIKKGQAQEWSPDDVKLAQALGTHLYMAVMQRRVEDMIRHQASHDALT
ncbi:MAG: GAF domain-containing protein, partial [Cyanobacteria bacterium CAN_BIN43]|nr:GAF domain-containing protein [Cyanobacteria bacterium CAN_BIN43]